MPADRAPLGWNPHAVGAADREARGGRREAVLDRIFLGNVVAPPAVNTEHASPVKAQFGESILLDAYEISAQPAAGQPLDVTLYWQALSPPPDDYTVFVHLLDEQGQIVGALGADARWIEDGVAVRVLVDPAERRARIHEEATARAIAAAIPSAQAATPAAYHPRPSRRRMPLAKHTRVNR